VKILHFSDLHKEETQLRNIQELNQKLSPDLIAITGDLTLWKSEVGDHYRLQEVFDYLEALDKEVPTAFCSGNHEAWSGMNSTHILKIFCQDNESRILQKEGENPLVISSFPWTDHGGNHYPTLKREEALLKKYPHAIRVWLHHEPPKGSYTGLSTAGLRGSQQLLELLKQKNPHYILSGHIHDTLQNGGNFCDKLHQTWCLNPGTSTTKTHFANFIEINTQTGQIIHNFL